MRIKGYENSAPTPDDHWTYQVVFENSTINCDNVQDLLHEDTINTGTDYRTVWRNLFRHLDTASDGERYSHIPIFDAYEVGEA